MIAHLIKPVGILSLCCVLFVGTGCTSTAPIKSAECVGIVTVTLVATLIASNGGPEAVGAVADISGQVAKAICVEAALAIIGTDPSPQNPATVLVIHDGTSQSVKGTLSLSTPFTVTNCNSAQPLVHDNIALQEGVQVVLTVGDRQFTAAPSSTDSDPLATIAQTLIVDKGIQVGSMLTAPISLDVTVPAHTQLVVTPPALEVNIVSGAAYQKQGTKVVGDPILWTYPASIQPIGQATFGLPTACA